MCVALVSSNNNGSCSYALRLAGIADNHLFDAWSLWHSFKLISWTAAVSLTCVVQCAFDSTFQDLAGTTQWTTTQTRLRKVIFFPGPWQLKRSSAYKVQNPCTLRYILRACNLQEIRNLSCKKVRKRMELSRLRTLVDTTRFTSIALTLVQRPQSTSRFSLNRIIRLYPLCNDVVPHGVWSKREA